MGCSDILKELNVLMDGLDKIMDILNQSTKEVIDTGNVNYQLKMMLDKLDCLIDIMEDEKEILESVKSNITYATLDTTENIDIFQKIYHLRDAKRILMGIKFKFDDNMQ